MNVDDFDFELPEALIAQTPLAGSYSFEAAHVQPSIGHGGCITDLHGACFICCRQVDTLVLNDTKGACRLACGPKPIQEPKRSCFYLKQLDGDRWETLAKPGKRLKVGAR